MIVKVLIPEPRQPQDLDHHGTQKLSSVEETAPLQLLALEPHLFRDVLSDPQP